MLDLAWNDQEGTLADILKVHIAQANRIDIAVAFLNSRGLSLIRDELQAALARGCILRLFVGTDFYLTDPEALRWLERAFRQQGKSKLLLVGRSIKSTFHPKIYAFEGNNDITVVLGSANLTHGGLSDNREACCIFTAPPRSDLQSKVRLLFSRYERAPDVKVATIWDIERYASGYRAFDGHRKRAEQEAAREIAPIPELDEGRFQSCLDAYLARGEADYRNRRAQYEKARGLLDQLAVGDIARREQFEAVWERLIGSAGVDRLWYSNRLYRRGHEAVPRFREVCQLVKAIRDGGDQPPQELFELGLRHTSKITGLGPNILTEIMNTYYPDRCAVLNSNPLTSLRYFGLSDFPDPSAFRGSHYARFSEIIAYIKELCGFESMGQADHFLNFVYWKVRNQEA